MLSRTRQTKTANEIAVDSRAKQILWSLSKTTVQLFNVTV